MRLFLCVCFAVLVTCELMVGTGIYDATGPVNDLLMMGMANPKQKGAGIHQRLRSRAFVALDTDTKKRIAFVSLDSGMGSLVLNNRVMEQLKTRFPGLYTFDNVGISGTHTHSGPSGFLQDVLFQFSGSGFQHVVLDTFVSAVVESIAMAHSKLQTATAKQAVGQVYKSSRNRSPTAYANNPEEERAQYPYNTDKNMTLLRFDSTNGTELGMFNWFAVHPTSMNNTNLLTSGDNKGFASYLFEKDINGPTEKVRPGMGEFVAAFASTNLGDVSPNTQTPRCRDTGILCDNPTSTCNGKNEQCSSSGPGKDMFESCEIIGRNQFQIAVELYNQAKTNKVVGSTVDSIQTYVKMPGLNVSDPVTGKPLGHLCYAAMGDSFAAGTTDGPGMFDFKQGTNSTNPFWPFIAGILHHVTPEEKACHYPKGILLPTGHINIPHPWAPDTLPVQILRIGDFVICVVPTEMTTMSGRRFRKIIKERLVSKGVITAEGTVVIAGLGNSYADYTTTFEEYQVQRYEGGSTIFGPHQLNAYIQEFGKLVDAMALGKKLPFTPPTDFSSKLSKGNTPSTDYYPSGTKQFGQVMADALPTYTAGQVVSVKFAGSNALNNLKTQSTYMEVQRCSDASCSSPVVVYVDGDWETRIHIEKVKKDLVLTTRVWTLQWFTSTNTSGNYRIVYYGTWCNDPLIGTTTFHDFTGVSRVFTVSPVATAIA